MAINGIEKQLQQYRLLKERQRLAEELASKPFLERILPNKIISILKVQLSNKKTDECKTETEVSFPDQNAILKSQNETDTASLRRQVPRATSEDIKFLDVKTINGVVEGSLNTSLQWSIFGLKVILWVIVYLLCLEFEVGALFVIFSAFYIILSNLGNRSKNHWEPSAYSVFNPNCQAIDGTINPEQFEKEIRYGF